MKTVDIISELIKPKKEKKEKELKLKDIFHLKPIKKNIKKK